MFSVNGLVEVLKALAKAGFIAMAAVRAPTMARMIQAVWRTEGKPPAASSAPVRANGSAKIVCANVTREK